MPTVRVRVVAGVDDGWISLGQSAYDNNDQKMACGWNPGGWDLSSWMRIPNVPILQGTKIKSARLLFLAGGDRGATVNTRIYGNNVDDAVAPANLAEYSALALTTAYTTWDGVSVQYPTGDGRTIISPDIAPVVQEIVDRPSFASLNAMLFVWKNNGSNQYYSVWQYDGQADAVTLLIEMGMMGSVGAMAEGML